MRQHIVDAILTDLMNHQGQDWTVYVQEIGRRHPNASAAEAESACETFKELLEAEVLGALAKSPAQGAA